MTLWPTTTHANVLTGLWVIAVVVGATGAVSRAAETIVPVTFSGGHEIGKNDYGRPVALIAAALEVEPEVFREAFSGVTPCAVVDHRGPRPEKTKTPC